VHVACNIQLLPRLLSVGEYRHLATACLLRLPSLVHRTPLTALCTSRFVTLREPYASAAADQLLQVLMTLYSSCAASYRGSNHNCTVCPACWAATVKSHQDLQTHHSLVGQWQVGFRDTVVDCCCNGLLDLWPNALDAFNLSAAPAAAAGEAACAASLTRASTCHAVARVHTHEAGAAALQASPGRLRSCGAAICLACSRCCCLRKQLCMFPDTCICLARLSLLCFKQTDTGETIHKPIVTSRCKAGGALCVRSTPLSVISAGDKPY
jgi:hypothetical protein